MTFWVSCTVNGSSALAETINEIRRLLNDAPDSMTEFYLDLDNLFPNRVKIPWVNMVPRPLLQHRQKLFVASFGIAYVTVFHDKLMNLYSKHVISS